ncbi:MAG: YceI family protein [Proteobacteria bacterium]|nr:YceI family protein [Pseudomonadota bacterium]
MAETNQRYTAVAIVLHWAIAFAILFNIPLGLWMHGRAEANDVSEGVFRAFQLHKSIGLTVLALSLVRIGWRLTHAQPPLPAHMPTWEKRTARITHFLFYVVMLALPLTGWLYVSAGWSVHTDHPLVVPTRYFGLFHVPDLFGLSHAGDDVRATAAFNSLKVHWALAWATLALAALHSAAALKHQLFDRDEVMAHMVPGLRAPFAKDGTPRDGTRLATLGLGLSITTLLALLALYTVFTLPMGGAAPQTPSTFQTVETLAADASAASTLATTSATATAATTTAAPPATAPGGVVSWRVNTAASSIGFSFVYQDPENGDTTFNGAFGQWRADIRFDPNDLAHSSAVVVIQTGSAHDGVDIHDRGLPTAEWFDAAAHPTAEFRTTSIRRSGAGYEAAGQLTIKGHVQPVTLPFTLSIDGDHARMAGHLSISRRDFDIGVHSDANDMISQNVTISVRVEASRAP